MVWRIIEWGYRMFVIGVRRNAAVIACVMICLGWMSQFLEAQNTTIGVGSPGPVVPKQGLLGTYYSYPVNSPTPPGYVPGSPATAKPVQAGTALISQSIDGPIDFNFQVTKPAGNGGSSDWFMVAWTGFLVVPTADNYTFYVSSDDGELSWFGNVASATPSLSFWNQRGTTTDTLAAAAYPAGKLPVRFEYEQGNGGAIMRVEWSSTAIARAVIPAANFLPPDGPDAPAGLTATGSTNSATPMVTVNWNTSTTPIAATNYILSRATAVGGPYTQVAVQSTTTFIDANVVFGTAYYYIVQGTATKDLEVGPASAPSAPATPVKPAIIVSPAGPITTSESGMTAVLTLTVNAVPTADVNVQITSNNPGQAILSGRGPTQTLQGPGSPINILIPNGTPAGTAINITVQGVRDFIANGDQPYVISFVVSGGGGGTFTGATIPNVNGKNLEGDVLGIVVTPLSGLVTTTNGGQATFTVAFSSMPTASTTVSVTSSDTTEGTVSPGTLTFTTTTGQVFDPATGVGGWNIAHIVTVTGVGANITYLNTPFTVNLSVTGGDGAYIALTNPNPIRVSVTNLHLEAPPALSKVWGCGLLGAEMLLPLGLASLWRRRRRNVRQGKPLF